MKIEKYTFGMGDRFAHQGTAQLQAIMNAWEQGMEVHPVWNKSNREHTIVKSKPDDLRAEADAAVAELGWKRPYYVDADHIGLKTVDAFIGGSNFYTIDVADFTGMPADENTVESFVEEHALRVGPLVAAGRELSVISEETLRAAARKFLLAIREAGKIYRHIEVKKGRGNFVTEVSVDETDSPQTPVELFLILAMIAGEGIPVQTIAPKFTGRFNKGVDYVGDLAQFEKEFDDDLAVLALAVREFGLPETLKLSIHSGSDKFSIYPIVRRLIKKHSAGLHVKTAGTTWLEEVIGLAEAGGEGLAIARDIYAGAYDRFDELAAPYSTVIDIDQAKLPAPSVVSGWSSEKFANTLRHVPSCPDYNLHFRQLIHVAFKVAAEMGNRYTEALRSNREIISRNVTDNLLSRQMKPVFGDAA